MEGDFRVTSVTFEDLGEPTELGEVVRAEFQVVDLEDRAAPFAARVGDVEVRVAARVPLTDTVVGFLRERPAPGDPVLFGYVGQGLVDTGLTYEPGNS